MSPRPPTADTRTAVWSSGGDAVRAALRWYLVWNAVALAGVVVGVLALSWVSERNEALRDAEVAARAIARSIVQPLVDDAVHSGDPAARARMQEVMAHRAQDGSLAHVKIWTDAGNGHGRVLWSDQAPLVGQTFELEAEEYALFGNQGTVSEISELDKAENRLERSDEQLIEVYTGTYDADGRPLLFEVYVSAEDLPDEVRDQVGVILPLPVAGVLALSMATLPLAVSLARRVDRAQQQMRSLLVNAVESSDLERRRIAQVLHDGVVQDLAAVGYSLESEARHPRRGGALRRHLDEVAAILRRDVTALRALLTDIHPPDLDDAGLGASVRGLVAQRDLPAGLVRFEIPDSLMPQPVSDRLAYRAIREALGNALRHAAAKSIVVRIDQDQSHTRFEVVDDGVGFDTSRRAPDGHLGMRLVSEMVVDAGGTLDVRSALGRGTRVIGSIPHTPPVDDVLAGW